MVNDVKICIRSKRSCGQVSGGYPTKITWIAVYSEKPHAFDFIQVSKANVNVGSDFIFEKAHRTHMG